MNKFFAWIAGKLAKSKLNLKEDKEMTGSKKWYASKTVWAGIVTALLGMYELVDLNIGPAAGFDLPSIPAWIYTFLGALGVYGRVDAKKSVE